MRITPDELYAMARPVLAAGRAFAFNISGDSMRPFLSHGSEVVLRARERYVKGDVVLARCLPDNRVMLHYVADVKEDFYVLMGAGNVSRKEICLKGDAIGAVENPRMSRLLLRVWHLLLPLRRILLRLR